MNITRLGPGDEARAHEMVTTMAAVFEEDCAAFNYEHMRELLQRGDFWAVAAIESDAVIGASPHMPCR
ncbi:MAG: hypothetical protein IPK60_11745 [Sandaracinaceae bacterium]|nr:hypothetical protein [Sandaracinaceae bacterium]